MMHRSAVLATVAAVLVAGSVHAAPLEPTQGKSVDLGTMNGMVYYTVEADGYRVVATLQTADDAATPVRFIATLGPEQSITLSTPRGEGEPAIELRLVRHGDQLVVNRGGEMADATRASDQALMR